MSVLGKKPFTQGILEGLTPVQLGALITLVNTSNGLTPTEVSLWKHNKLISDSNKGVSYVSMELDEVQGKIVKGYLCYIDNDRCAIFSFQDGYKEIEIVKINPVDKTYEYVYENLTAEEFRRTIDDVAESGSEGGVVIQVDNDTIVSGWQVPDLTVEQVTQAYNALVAGRQCIITNEDGTVHYVAILSDVVTGHANIVITHYWLGYVDYQVTDSGDDVEIVTHVIGSGGGTKFYEHAITGVDTNGNTHTFICSTPWYSTPITTTQRVVSLVGYCTIFGGGGPIDYSVNYILQPDGGNLKFFRVKVFDSTLELAYTIAAGTSLTDVVTEIEAQ